MKSSPDPSKISTSGVYTGILSMFVLVLSVA